MIYTPIAWFLLASAALLGWIAVYMRRYRNLPASLPFSVLMGLGALWSALYALNLSTIDFDLKFAWSQTQMLVAIFMAPALLVFVIEYTGQDGWLTRQNLGWLLAVPAIIALAILTSHYHALFRYNFRLDLSGPIPILLSDKGPLFWLYQLYASSATLTACGLLIGAFRFRTLYFRNTLFILAGVILPSVTHLLYLAGVTPIRGLELSPFTFVFTGLVYLYALHGSFLFEVTPIARQTVMDSIADAAIVLDLRDHLADFNQAAERTCGLSLGKIGLPAAALSQPWGEFFQRYAAANSANEETRLEIDSSPRIFDLTISPLLDNHGRSLGRLFLLREITKRKQAEAALRESEARYFNVVQKKICLLGDFAVGKTSLMRRYVEGRFDDKYLSTIGVKISRKTLFREYGQLNLLIWDMTGGDDIGTQARASYLRGAAGALVVCDLTRRETLTVFERYASQMRALNPKTPLVLVGNKSDLDAERVILDSDMQQACSALGSETFYLTSAKTGTGVEEVFTHMAELVEKSA